jgi:hypothetical protein
MTPDSIVDTDEGDRRLELLHQNVVKFNTVAAGAMLGGTIRRAASDTEA